MLTVSRQDVSYEKAIILLLRLKAFEINAKQYVGRFKLYQAIDQIIGRQLDRLVADQIYDQCQKDANGNIQAQEYVTKMLEAEEILKRKIAATLQAIEQYSQKLENCRKELTKAKEERQNVYGIDKDSRLSVQLVDAVGLEYFGGYNPPVFVFTCGKERKESKLQHIAFNAGVYEWNELFQFSVESPDQDLTVEAFQVDLRNPNQHRLFLGYTFIVLESLKAQVATESYFPLLQRTHQPRPEPTGVQVRLKLQWVHNKFIYYEELQFAMNKHYDSLNEDMMDFQRDLAVLQEPFKETIPKLEQHFSYGYNLPLSKTQLLIAGNPKMLAQIQAVGPASNYHGQFPLDEESEIASQLRFGLITTLVFLLIGFLECFVKPAYLDIMIAFVVLSIYALNEFEASKIRYSQIACAVTILWDLLFIYFASTDQKSKSLVEKVDRMEGIASFEYGLLLVLTWIALFAKFVFIYSLKLFYDLTLQMNGMGFTKYITQAHLLKHQGVYYEYFNPFYNKVLSEHYTKANQHTVVPFR